MIISYILPATPADVSLLMQLGVDGVFVGSGIFKSSNPVKRARAMAKAVTYYNDPITLAEISEDLGTPMSGPTLKESTEKELEGKMKIYNSILPTEVK